MLRHYFWKYRKYATTGIAALLLVDLLEIIPPLLLKETVDTLTIGGTKSRLFQIALIYLAITLVQAVGRYMWRMFLIRSSMFSGRDMRQNYSSKLFGLSAGFYDRQKVGDLMALATSDVEAVRMALGAGLLVFADAMFYLITIPIAMFILSPQLTLLAFIPLLTVPFIVMRNEREIHKRFEKVQSSFSQLASLAQESLVGARIVKSFAAEESMIKRFRDAGLDNARLNIHLAKVQTAFGPILDFNVSIGLVLLLYFGGESVIGQALSLGTFVAFQRYIQKLVWPMAALGLAITHYQRAVASSKRLKVILQERPEISAVPATARKLTGHIEMKNLTFGYPGLGKPVLKNLNLVIEKGSRVAFVGPIGSGKTTLLSLLPRLYAVQRNQLFLDGYDINDWCAEELREQIGFVAQDVFLFSESIVENVCFGLAYPRHHIEMTTATAMIHEEIQRFPAAYETKLGERGLNVSGGQKQRLSIARALIRQPPLLILDDALSSVDVHTEEKILGALKNRTRTELVSAHRISTVKNADEIFVMNEGEIIQRGPHKRLIAENGLYRLFHEQQKIQEEFDAYLQEI
jgi:ATP-binding cassette, subfamily B, multidrug efflux pump